MAWVPGAQCSQVFHVFVPPPKGSHLNHVARKKKAAALSSLAQDPSVAVGPKWPRDSWSLERKLYVEYASTVCFPTAIYLVVTALLRADGSWARLSSSDSGEGSVGRYLA